MWQRTNPGLSLSLFSSFLLHWLRSTRDPRRRTRLGWSRTHTHTPERSHTAQERERDTHTRTWRASLHSHSSSSPLHGGKRWARPEPCLVSTSLANLHHQRSYGGRGAVRAGVWTTPLPRKASILPCAAKAAHYTPCCPTFAFPSPRRMTQFSRGLRRSRTDIGAEDGTTTPEGATRTVQRDLGILLARRYSP